MMMMLGLGLSCCSVADSNGVERAAIDIRVKHLLVVVIFLLICSVGNTSAVAQYIGLRSPTVMKIQPFGLFAFVTQMTD